MPSPLARRVSPDVACVTPELVLIEHHHHCSSRWVLELTEAQFIESHAQFPLSPNNPQLRRMEESPPPLPTPTSMLVVVVQEPSPPPLDASSC